MNPYEQIYDVDLSKGITQKDIGTLVFEGDNNSIKVGSNVYNSGVPQQLSGSIEGKVIRQDGGTVYYVGTISDNTGYITLTEAAFAYPGPIEIFVRIVSGQDKITIGAFKAKAKRTDTGKAIDPGQPVPGIAELAEDVEELKTGKKNTQTAIPSPSASGNALAFIDTISQDAQGVITATKKSVTIDATPTANSTNPVQSSGIKEGLDKKLNTIGKGVNLLDNWYFIGGGSQQGGRKFPINQRGQTDYNSTGYAIDRWRVPPNGNAGSIQLNSSYLSLKKAYFYFEQFLTTPILSNNVYTISVLTDSGLYSKSGKPSFTLNLVGSAIISVNNGFVSLNMQSLTSLNIIAIKLELGDTQTLAHQENGEWVLNDPPPNYNMELLKCQTSTADSRDTYANKQLIPAEHNAGAHNAIYRGKYLGNAVTAAQYSAISAGTFDDLFIGDYWTINGVDWRIAAFDYWLHTGDTECTTHHVVIVPDTALTTGKMNSTDIVTGAYVGSDFYTGNNNNTAKANATTIIEAAFGQNHILSHRERFPNAVKSGTGRVTADAHYDSMVDLMNEPMVYGHYAMDCNSPDGTTEPSSGGGTRIFTFDATQLPLFSHSKDKIIIRGVHWWLRDTTSPSKFTNAFDTGISGASNASATIGIRPTFGLVG